MAATGERSLSTQPSLPTLLPDQDPPAPQHMRRTSKKEEIEAGQFEIRESPLLPAVPPDNRSQCREIRRSVLEIPKEQNRSKEDGRTMCAACCLQ